MRGGSQTVRGDAKYAAEEGSMADSGDKARRYDLEERLVAFACRIIDVVEALPNARAGNHIGGQLIRCGTSPAPNYAEALGAESRRDFVHKLKVCLKELRETRVWLLMIQRKALIRPEDRLAPVISEADELISIFVTSIGTAQKKQRRSSPISKEQD